MTTFFQNRYVCLTISCISLLLIISDLFENKINPINFLYFFCCTFLFLTSKKSVQKTKIPFVEDSNSNDLRLTNVFKNKV